MQRTRKPIKEQNKEEKIEPLLVLKAPNPIPLQLALTIKEACKATSLGRTTLYRLAREKVGGIQILKVGKRSLITVKSIEDLLERLRKESSDEK